MNAVLIIQYISMVIWSLPPLRQHKGNFFYYFLFVSLADPLLFVIYPRMRLIPSNLYYVFSLLAALTSIIAVDNKIRWKVVMPVYIAVTALGLSIPNWDISYIIVVLLVIVIYYSIRYIIIFAAKKRYVSLFHFLFLIYNSSLLLKTISAMVDPVMGATYYYSTTIFDIMLGVLFCIFREEDKLFSVKLADPEAGESIS